MFEHAVLDGSQRKRWAFATLAGFAGEAAIALALILAPMIWPQVLPAPRFTMAISPPAPAPKPPERTVAAQPRATHSPAMIFRPELLMPMRIPQRVTQIDDSTEPPVELTLGVPGGIGEPSPSSQLLRTLLNSPSPVERPVEPKSAPKPAAEEVKRIRVSSLDPARLLHFVEPVYPQIAKSARIEGTVELRAVIGADGRVRQLDVISGHPLLRKAAIDAVNQWIYKPPVLNGESVEIVAPIAVVFHLN